MDHLTVVTGHNQLHHVLEVQFHFLERYFHFEVFHVPVGLSDELLKLGFTAGVFFEELAVLLVRFHQGLPDIVRRNRHAFPPGWIGVHIIVTISTVGLWRPIGKICWSGFNVEHCLHRSSGAIIESRLRPQRSTELPKCGRASRGAPASSTPSADTGPFRSQSGRRSGERRKIVLASESAQDADLASRPRRRRVAITLKLQWRNSREAPRPRCRVPGRKAPAIACRSLVAAKTALRQIGLLRA